MFQLIHSCLNCDKEIRNSNHSDYHKSLGYVLCSKKCLKEINDAFHETYPKAKDAYNINDVYKKTKEVWGG